LKRQFVVVLLLISSLVPLVSALADDQMTSDEAATLLKKHEMFAATQTIKLIVGTIHAKLSDVARYQPNYLALKEMGLIDLESATIESPDKDPAKNSEGTRVWLTDAGLKESASWAKGRENEWIITVAARRLVEIVKIHKDGEDRVHGIEFSWTWAPNKIGEGLKLSYASEKAYAKLERDGAEWRITSIHAL
jgi:hypothetical protein